MPNTIRICSACDQIKKFEDREMCPHDCTHKTHFCDTCMAIYDKISHSLAYGPGENHPRITLDPKTFKMGTIRANGNGGGV